MAIWLRRAIANLKLKKKLVFLVAIAAVLAVAMSVAGQTVILNKYNDLLYDSMAGYLLTSVNYIENALYSVADASAFMISDQIVQNQLETYNNFETPLSRRLAAQSLYTTLHQHSTQNKYIKYISIIENSGESWVVYTNPRVRNTGNLQMIEETAFEEQGGAVWLYPEDISEILCTRSILKIKNLSLKELGTLVIHVDLDKIVQDAERSVYPKSSRLAIVSGDAFIYPRGGLPISKSLRKRYEIIKLGEERQFIVQSDVGQYGWIYYNITPYNEIFDTILFSRNLLIFAVFLSVALAICIAKPLTDNINRHFVTLIKKMDSFKGGNLKPIDVQYDYSWRQDELGMIHRHFDQMLLKISELIDDIYVKQLLIKDAQLKNLESQINPHFLYNTLDAIYWRSKAAKEFEISEMVEALGSLLRISLSEYADSIPLHRELEFVDNYIKIQKIRFAKRMDFSSEIDPVLLNLPIPKMSIQPLVENAIKYSLEEVLGNCIIRLQAQADNNTAFIRVSNTGSEIDENILELLSEKEVQPHGSGIGLANIDKRVKLLFGNEYGLSFINIDGYTVVEMKLPFEADYNDSKEEKE